MSALSMAWRNIWRNRRRTLISMSAIGIGLLLVIFYSGLIGGVLSDAKNQLDNGGMGHIEIFAKGFRPKRAVNATMPVASTFQLPEGSEVGSRVVSRGLASSARGNEAVEVSGVEWQNERLLSAHLRAIREGAPPAEDDANGVLVGDHLAHRLGLKIGSKLRLMVQRADGEMGADLFRVRGIFHSIAQQIGLRQVYVSQGAARALVGLEGPVVHQVVIQLADPNAAEGIAARLQTELGDGFEVRSWGELMPVMKRMEALSTTLLYAVAAFVYFLVGLGVLNTMLMSVLERTREFGVLMALGTNASRLVQLVLAESFLIATISVIFGVAVGGWLTWHFSHAGLHLMGAQSESVALGGMNLSSVFKTRFYAGDVAAAAALVYVMAMIVGLFPAVRIARMQPTEALRRT